MLVIKQADFMWKVTDGKQDCWGNVNHWRVHLANDWWTGAAICASRQEADDLAIERNRGVVPLSH